MLQIENHFLYALTLPLTVNPWSLHCECADTGIGPLSRDAEYIFRQMDHHSTFFSVLCSVSLLNDGDGKRKQYPVTWIQVKVFSVRTDVVFVCCSLHLDILKPTIRRFLVSFH